MATLVPIEVLNNIIIYSNLNLKSISFVEHGAGMSFLPLVSLKLLWGIYILFSHLESIHSIPIDQLGDHLWSKCKRKRLEGKKSVVFSLLRNVKFKRKVINSYKVGILTVVGKPCSTVGWLWLWLHSYSARENPESL